MKFSNPALLAQELLYICVMQSACRMMSTARNDCGKCDQERVEEEERPSAQPRTLGSTYSSTTMLEVSVAVWPWLSVILYVNVVVPGGRVTVSPGLYVKPLISTVTVHAGSVQVCEAGCGIVTVAPAGEREVWEG